MTTKEKTIVGVIVAVILVGIVFSYLKNTNRITPLPSPSVTPDSSQKYKDLMNKKCYNLDDVEVPCKG